ncbi:putative disease resistance protein [Sesamum alatum]|uniref:Disease resistance protein n=1 Tax=Sesamum alatum TaxID=300844 RepID=A0AAE2CJK9_9LAMI|nr:putative disease resistance protein [Sesamum alatum]
MVDAVATIALETVRDLLIDKARFLLNVSGQVEEVQRQLTVMHCFMKDADKWKDRYNSDVVRHWIAELRGLSIKAENVLERYAFEVMSKREGKNLKEKLKRFTCILSECLSIDQIGKEIEVIMSCMGDLTKQLESINKGESSSRSTDDSDWSRKSYGLDVEIYFVGMKEEIKLLELLVQSDDISHQVISICGMGGLGKTTTATKIYNGEVAQHRFEARAWICISQQFQPKSVFQALLKQLDPHSGEEQDENELVRKLYNVQKEKKCLVVLDDVWEINHWNSLSPAFPVLESSSKVLLTTRNQNIASTQYVHMLGCLSEDEGWELLQKIALSTHHPQDLTRVTELKLLEETGREIVRKCGCLPLPISVIGGTLRQERSLIEWQKVCKNIDSYLQHGKGMEKDRRVAQILDLSYNVLPYNLKPCFLYLGCFPEDKEIYTEQLYLIWMAEGMILSEDRGRGETLRDVAERYLFELASRCMVQVEVDEESVHNRFKSCRLHDMIRELCLSKAKEEEFLMVMDTQQTRRQDERSVCRTTRLAIHLDEMEGDYIWGNQNLRSLLLLGKQRGEGDWDNLGGINLGMFKLLKILILECHKFKNKKMLKGLEKLILLKHFSIRYSEVDELPKSVCKLPCLQSLDLRVLGCEIELPNLIHELRHLRHLFLLNHSRTITGGGKLKLDGLNDLETLIGFNSETDDATSLLKLPKLQRVLDGNVSDQESLSMIVDHIFNHQDRFREIQLTISNNCNLSSEEGANLVRKMLMCHSITGVNIYCRVSKLPSYKHELYRNLVTLILWFSHIEKDPMEILENLPMLRYLRFWDNSYMGREMVCRATRFPQLRLLSLDGLPNLKEWRVEEGAMPNLSSLYIRKCNKLEIIPDGLKFIITLKELFIDFMPKEFVDRARVMDGEEGEDYHKIKHIPSVNLYAY